MPHANKASAPVSVDIPEFEGRYVNLDGHAVGFEIYKADVDPSLTPAAPCQLLRCTDGGGPGRFGMGGGTRRVL